MSLAPAFLDLSIIIFTKEVNDDFPSYADEHHVALTLEDGAGYIHRYHATEDPNTEDDMKFEHTCQTNSNHLNSLGAHQAIVVKRGITQHEFKELHCILESTNVPRGRSRPKGWNCQSWVRDAMKRMEPTFLNARGADSYYDGMMKFIDQVADKRPSTSAAGRNTFYGK